VGQSVKQTKRTSKNHRVAKPSWEAEESTEAHSKSVGSKRPQFSENLVGKQLFVEEPNKRQCTAPEDVTSNSMTDEAS